MRFFKTRHRDVPGKVREAAAQVQLCTTVLFDFAARMFLVGYKTAYDRLRPDDSVFSLICVLGRFDNEIVRNALKDLADQFWPGDAIGDGAVGVDAPAVDNVPVGEALEAVVLHNADPPVRTSELLDHAHRDFHCVVDDIVLADRVHAVDGQAGISVEARPGSHGRFERIALFTRKAMVVAGRVHVETTVYQVFDVCLLGRELEQVCDAVFEHGVSFHERC